MSENIKFLQGNEACVEAAMYAGLDFYAGYPITPSSEVAELLAVKLPQSGGKFIQMEDEIGSICAIIGASQAGARSMTATSGPGFSLMQEALGYAIMAEIPCVILDVQRGGPSTGLPTQTSQADVNQTRWGVHGDHSIIVLTASNHQDIFNITVEAFNFSEYYRTPVILLFDETVGHMREKLVIPAPGELEVFKRITTQVKESDKFHPYLTRYDGLLPMANFGEGKRHNVTGLVHDMWGFPSTAPHVVNDLIYRLSHKIEHDVNKIARYKTYFVEDADTILLAYGASVRTAMQTMYDERSKGEKIGLLELQTLWPFPKDIVREYCAKAKTVVVVEMNLGQVYASVRNAVDDPHKVYLANRVDGKLISPEDVAEILWAVDQEGI